MIRTTSIANQKTVTEYDKLTNYSSTKHAQQIYEEYRGGMAISYAFVQHNRVYKGYESFNIPWSNKDLNISYETFRDKLLPGAEEKWKIKITGNKGEKVAAEMLAGMYDASLDQFKMHNWYRPNIWPGLYNSISWTANGFTDVNSEEFDKRDYQYLNGNTKIYDKLFSSYNLYRTEVAYMMGYERQNIRIRSTNSPIPLEEKEMQLQYRF